VKTISLDATQTAIIFKVIFKFGKEKTRMTYFYFCIEKQFKKAPPKTLSLPSPFIK